jgi:hypothetical protein
MPQPTAYTRSTDFSQDEAENVGGRSTIRNDRVDAELDAVAASISGIRTNLSLIQRDDGGVRDGVVELWCLSTSARVALQLEFNPAGLWETATAYAINDLVDVAGDAYLCVEAHTSSVFATEYAAGKWQILTGSATAAGVEFTPTDSMTSTSVQAAIEEVNAIAEPSTAPLAAFYGAF